MNSWTVERLRGKTVEEVQHVESWNRLTVEQLNEETVWAVNGWTLERLRVQTVKGDEHVESVESWNSLIVERLRV